MKTFSRINKLKRDRYDALIKKSPITYFVEKKKKTKISLKQLFHLPSRYTNL